MKGILSIFALLLVGMATLQTPAQQLASRSTNLVSQSAKDFLDASPNERTTGSTTNIHGFDIDKFIAELKAKAEKGDAEAQTDLGIRYQLGDAIGESLGVVQNYAEAAKWYRKAAEQGNSLAQYSLAQLYEKGNGVESNLGKAEALYWQAYSNTPPHVSEGNLLDIAKKYLSMSNGVARAIRIYTKLADDGYPDAQTELAKEYNFGNGDLPKDYAEAAKWYLRAAEQGKSEAQCNLGMMYADGEGVPQDYIEAYKWYNLAAASCDTDAIILRSSLARRMTPDQIAEGQRLSREFKPGSVSSSDSSSTPDNPAATGTGFFITDDGYLISNYHVVKDAAKVRLQTGAGTVDAKVVQTDAANDLALLKAEGQFSSLPIAPSRTVTLGGTVATVGFPNIGLQGFAPKLAKGEIASLSGAGDDPRYFQTSVPVQPGNSGGALVDERGNVVGVVSAKLDAAAALASSGALPENVNYAVKSGFLLTFLESVPDVSAKLKPPNTADEKFEDVVKSAQAAAVLVLVY